MSIYSLIAPLGRLPATLVFPDPSEARYTPDYTRKFDSRGLSDRAENEKERLPVSKRSLKTVDEEKPATRRV